jgi:hypothetical protein
VRDDPIPRGHLDLLIRRARHDRDNFPNLYVSRPQAAEILRLSTLAISPLVDSGKLLQMGDATGNGRITLWAMSVYNLKIERLCALGGPDYSPPAEEPVEGALSPAAVRDLANTVREDVKAMRAEMASMRAEMASMRRELTREAERKGPRLTQRERERAAFIAMRELGLEGN